MFGLTKTQKLPPPQKQLESPPATFVFGKLTLPSKFIFWNRRYTLGIIPSSQAHQARSLNRRHFNAQTKCAEIHRIKQL